MAIIMNKEPGERVRESLPPHPIYRPASGGHSARLIVRGDIFPARAPSCSSFSFHAAFIYDDIGSGSLRLSSKAEYSRLREIFINYFTYGGALSLRRSSCVFLWSLQGTRLVAYRGVCAYRTGG